MLGAYGSAAEEKEGKEWWGGVRVPDQQQTDLIHLSAHISIKWNRSCS
jgi:hypothetical protein